MQVVGELVKSAIDTSLERKVRPFRQHRTRGMLTNELGRIVEIICICLESIVCSRDD